MKRAFTLASIATIAGCSLFGLDGFSGGEAPTADGDGGGTSDATSDPPQKQSPPADDATADGAPNGPFCKTIGADAAVCDDFEEPGTFTGKWPEQDQYLGTLEVKDAIGIGGTRGLRFAATPSTGSNARVVLGFTTPSVASFIDAEVAVKLTQWPPSLYLAGPLYVTIDQIDGGGYVTFGFRIDGAGVLTTNPVIFPADAGAISSGAKAIATIGTGVWTRVRLVVDLGKSPPGLYAYVDGTLKNEQSIDQRFQPSKISVRIGAQFAGNDDASAIGMDLDDARVSWK